MELKLCILIFLILCHLATSESVPSSVRSSPCGDADWVQFKDEKCFKLVKSFVVQEEAESLCKSQQRANDNTTPSVLSIKSAEEQEFVTEYLFRSSAVENNVWTGAKRGAGGDFVWSDGSPLEYTNWGPDSPSDSAARGCVVLQSDFSRKKSSKNPDNVAGKWRDVSCKNGHFALCEKVQTWSFAQLQDTLLSGIKELRDKNRKTQHELDVLEKNPVPLGFIYAQLAGQLEPATLWPATVWEDVSGNYSGLFFRVVGGDAAQFGELQEANAPRLVSVKNVHVTQYKNEVTLSANDEWSELLFSGCFTGDYQRAHSYKTSSAEVRPRNQAMRLWKRTG